MYYLSFSLIFLLDTLSTKDLSLICYMKIIFSCMVYVIQWKLVDSDEIYLYIYL
jgi:hypothetical protein